jgi:hypothetical protein
MRAEAIVRWGVILLFSAWVTAAFGLQVLPLNGSASGALSASHTEDHWSVTLPQDGSLTVTIVSDASLEADANLYDSDDATVLVHNGASGTTTVMTFDHFRAGTYWARPYRYNGQGNYTISNTFTPADLANDPEPNDTLPQALALGSNASATGHIGYYGSAYTDLWDWYKVAVPEDGDLQITVTQDKAGDVVDIDFYDTNGTTVLSTSHRGSATETVRVPNLMPGTFFLGIKRYGGFCSYTVQSTLVPPAWGNDAEPNDTAQQAVGLGSDASLTGHIGYYAGGVTDLSDWYRISLPSEGRLTVTVTQDRTGDVIDTDFYASDGTTWLSSSHTGNPSEVMSPPNLKAGTYLVFVKRYSQYCAYTIQSDFAPQPIANDAEPNDSAQTAQAASNFAPLRAHLGYTDGFATDAVDWFRFSLGADGKFWLEVLSDATLEAEADLYKSDGATLVSTDHRNGIYSRVGSEELMAGEYLLKISRYWGYGGYTVTPTADLLFVNLLGPTTVVPGESIVYSVRYGNPLSTALNDVVVRAELPYALAHAGTTGGGTYYANECCGNQVFWKLGTLPAGGNGQVTFTLAVPWGTPDADTCARAQLGASNLPDGSPFDVQPYLAYQPEEPLSEWVLSSGQITAELAGDAGMRALYEKLLGEGYQFFGTAMGWVLPDGTRIVRIFLMRSSDGVQAILSSDGQRAFAEVFDGDAYTILDTGGGSTWDRALGTWTPWGTWAASPREDGSPEGFTGLREAQCQLNCTLNSIPEVAADVVLDQFANFGLYRECVLCAASMKAGTPDAEACAVCTAEVAKANSETIARKIPVIGNAVSWVAKVAKCVRDCIADPSLHICTEDKWDCGCWDLLGWLGGFESRCHTRCNRVTGTYAPVTERIQCAYGQKCLDGQCVPESQVCSGKACREKPVKIRPSHDPNAKHADFLGEVLPGQRLSYTLEYENAGAGTAFGVFILDALDADLDEATLLINDGGSFSPASRMVDFEIGDVPPGGKGSVSFSVAVKATAAHGTEIVNQADIYFPNALEVTPTNGVVNRVATIVADPKELDAIAGAPAPVTLSGRSATGGALTYRVLSPPLFGTLVGDPPALTYTAEPQNVGPNAFTYSVSDGTSESSPAEVSIFVGPDPDDHAPPQVLSTFPEDGATGILPRSEPVGTNPLQYTPSITATFSEPLDPASVSSGSMAVGDLSGTVAYDAQRRTLCFVPGVPLAGQRSYTARVLAGLRDFAGNAMPAQYSWTFTTGGGAPGDCDGSGTVSIGEVQKAINMFLGTQAVGCGVDCNGDGAVSIGEVQKVINGFLGNPTSC